MLWHIVAGKRFDYRDPGMTNLVRMLNHGLKINLMKPNASWFFPALANIFPVLEEDGTKGRAAPKGLSVRTYRPNLEPNGRPNVGSACESEFCH